MDPPLLQQTLFSSDCSFQFILLASYSFSSQTVAFLDLSCPPHTRASISQPHPTSPPIHYMSTTIRLVTFHNHGGSLMFWIEHVQRDSNFLHYLFQTSQQLLRVWVNVSTAASASWNPHFTSFFCFCSQHVRFWPACLEIKRPWSLVITVKGSDFNSLNCKLVSCCSLQACGSKPDASPLIRLTWLWCLGFSGGS